MNMSLFRIRVDPATWKAQWKTSTERNVEIRSNRNRKQKIERRAFADSCIATWPWAIGTRWCAIWWNHFLVSTFRARVTPGSPSRSVSLISSGCSGTFSRIARREDALLHRGGAHRDGERGQDAYDVCAIVKTTRVLPSGLSFIAISTSERVHRVLNDSRLSFLLFSLSRTFQFSFRRWPTKVTCTRERGLFWYTRTWHVELRKSAANPAADFEAAKSC